MAGRWMLVLALALCMWAIAPRAQAMVGVDVNEDIDSVLAGKAPPLHLPGIKYRVAVFEFEDPDRTGLGSALSTLVAREILLRSQVRSLGVLNYYGSLAPTSKHPQSYFDKVDLVVRAQRASLALWGVVRRDGKSIVVDVQVQLPDPVVAESFSRALVLPRAMGGGTLRASLSPTRMQVQHVRLPLDFSTTLAAMASSGNIVRAAPSRTAAVATRIPKYSALSVAETRGAWSKFVVDGKAGWVQRPTECVRECAQLLGTASFVGALLRFADGGPAPPVSKDLSRDTVVVARQLGVLADLREGTFRPAEAYLARWDGGRSSDYGAPYAGLLAIGTIAAALGERADRPYDEIRLDDALVRSVASGLARASQDDPRNAQLLENLAVLFRILGDEARAGLASRLAAGARRVQAAEPER